MKKLLLLLAIAIIPVSGNAALISYDYSGNVSSMLYADCTGYRSSGSCNSWDHSNITDSSAYNDILFSVGDLFSGQFTYDTDSTLSGISSGGAQGVYLSGIAEYAFSINEFSTPSTDLPPASHIVSVVNNRGSLDMFATTQTYLSTDWSVQIRTYFLDNTGAVFDSFDMPDYLNLNDYSYALMGLTFLRRSDGDQLRLTGIVTELNPVSVPEPSTFLLMLSSLFVILFSRRRIFSIKHLTRP